MGNKTVTASLLASQGRRISVPTIYIDLTGDLAAGVVLAQLTYWWTKMDFQMFYKSMDSIMEECRITKKQYVRVMRIIKEQPWVTVVKKGVPPKNYFDFDADILAQCIYEYEMSNSAQMGTNNSAQMGTNNSAQMGTYNTIYEKKEIKKEIKSEDCASLEEKEESDSLTMEDVLPHSSAKITTLKSGAKKHPPKKVSITDVLKNTSKDRPEPELVGTVSSFAAYWRWALIHVHGAEFVVSLTNKQKGQLKLIISRAGKYSVPMFKYVMKNWDEFRSEVYRKVDKKVPEYPRIEVLLMYVDQGVSCYKSSLKTKPDVPKPTPTMDKPVPKGNSKGVKTPTLEELEAIEEEIGDV